MFKTFHASLGRRCLVGMEEEKGLGRRHSPKRRCVPWRYRAMEKMIPREKVAGRGGAEKRMWAKENTFPREKMYPWGWRRKWG
jgi:hypothetical protein